MKHCSKMLLILCLCFTLLTLAGPSFAVEPPDITVGLDQVDANTLADKILKIALGGGALSGVIAAGMLVFLGFKLKTGNERTRADTRDHIKWVFIGMGVVGFAVVIAGFAAFLIKGA